MTQGRELREPQVHGRYRVGDRVRVLIGMSANQVGSIVYCGGDRGTYYGVKLDSEPKPIGYTEGELSRE